MNFDSTEEPKVLTVDGIEAGKRVRIFPKHRADILDLALTGMTAVVESIEQDFEGRIYVAITLDDDPGKELGQEGKPGHRFFFLLDEVQLI